MTGSETLPTVATPAATSIATTSATLGGTVTADGGASVTDRGVVYALSSANTNPLIGGTGVAKVQIGSGTGSFGQSVGSLAPGSSYHFNAYAINSAGTNYGSVSSFTTLAPQINITGNGQAIINGAAAQSANGTKFRALALGSLWTNTFSITNSGTGTLSISGHGNSGSKFQIAGLPSSVSVGGASNFTVVYSADEAGSHTSVLTISNNSPTTVYTVNLAGSCFALSPNNGPYAGGNTITITNGNFGTITNVLVGGVAAGIQGSGGNWVTITIPATGSAGAKDIVIQTSGNGDTTLAGAYTVNPAGAIGGVEEDWTQWQEVAGLPDTRYLLAASAWNGSLYALGGTKGMDSFSTVYRFDGTDWSVVTNLPEPRAYLAASEFQGGLYALGGDDESFPSDSTYRYDGTHWQTMAAMPAGNMGLAASVLNDRLYAFGGSSWNSAESYVFNGTNWAAAAAMPAWRYYLAAGTLNGRLYAIGGWSDNGVLEYACTNVYAFDGTNWQEVAGLPAARGLLAASVMDGWLYAIGGSDGGGSRTNVYRFDGTNWQEVAGLPAPRAWLGAATLDGAIYAIGGLGTQVSTNVYRYPARVVLSGVAPSSGSWTGGYPVVITGLNLGNGADITNVTICGVPATILPGQSATQVIVTAGVAATPGLGDVRVFSTSLGETVKSNGFTYIKTDATLTIQSPYGVGVPPVGVYTNAIGVGLTNAMSSPDTQGTTQFVCAGWAMSGHSPASGSDTQVVMTVTNDAVLTWRWTTNYLLNTAAGAHGSVLPATGWQAFGSNVAVTATADACYHFTNWTGDASGGANPLNLLMDGPKSVTASFAANMTTNAPAPVPQPWLAQYGLTNFEEAVNADPDHDGQKTWEEYIASESNPTNPASFFHTEQALASGTNYVENIYTNEQPPHDIVTQRIAEVQGALLSWPSVSGRLYDVQTIGALAGSSWAVTVWSNQPATPPLNTVTNPCAAMTNAVQFFRAVGRMAE